MALLQNRCNEWPWASVEQLKILDIPRCCFEDHPLIAVEGVSGIYTKWKTTVLYRNSVSSK